MKDVEKLQMILNKHSEIQNKTFTEFYTSFTMPSTKINNLKLKNKFRNFQSKGSLNKLKK